MWFADFKRRWAEAHEAARKYLGIKPAAPIAAIQTRVVAVCHACNKRHNVRCHMGNFAVEVADWERKHPASRGCITEYVNLDRVIPKRFDDRQWWRLNRAPLWMAYGENTNFTFVYRAAATLSNAITSLATSATFVAGYESAAYDNMTTKDLDVLLSFQSTVGTTPTANTIIEHNCVSMMDDAAGATWPDVFDGTESAETITSVGVKSTVCVPYDFINCDSATTARVYYLTKRSTAALYGGICPDKFVIFTTHNTGVNLNATGTNHKTWTQAVYVLGT